jgi:hypothetical protein
MYRLALSLYAAVMLAALQAKMTSVVQSHASFAGFSAKS